MVFMEYLHVLGVILASGRKERGGVRGKGKFTASKGENGRTRKQD